MLGVTHTGVATDSDSTVSSTEFQVTMQATESAVESRFSVSRAAAQKIDDNTTTSAAGSASPKPRTQDHQHADEARHHRAPAPQAHAFTEHKRRADGAEDYRREAERGRLGDGHHARALEPGQHGDQAEAAS